MQQTFEFGDRVVLSGVKGGHPFPIGKGPFVITAVKETFNQIAVGHHQVVYFVREGRNGLQIWNKEKYCWEGKFTLADTAIRGEPSSSGAWFRKVRKYRRKCR